MNSTPVKSNPSLNISAQEYQLKLMGERKAYCVWLAELPDVEFICNTHLLKVN